MEEIRIPIPVVIEDHANGRFEITPAIEAKIVDAFTELFRELPVIVRLDVVESGYPGMSGHEPRVWVSKGGTRPAQKVDFL